MIANFHHIFFLKKERIHARGLFPIYLRITIAGKRAEFSTGIKADEKLWIPKVGRLNDNSRKIKEINAYLGDLEHKLYDSYYEMVRQKEAITAIALKCKLSGVEENPKMLIPIFQKHNKRIATLVPKEYSAGTLERYKTSLSHTIEFMEWKYQVADIDIRQSTMNSFLIMISFYDQFVNAPIIQP